jgi:hypothetical protein
MPGQADRVAEKGQDMALAGAGGNPRIVRAVRYLHQAMGIEVTKHGLDQQRRRAEWECGLRARGVSRHSARVPAPEARERREAAGRLEEACRAYLAACGERVEEEECLAT